MAQNGFPIVPTGVLEWDPVSEAEARIANAPRAWVVRSKGYKTGYKYSQIYTSYDDAEEYARDYGGCIIPIALVELKEGE